MSLTLWTNVLSRQRTAAPWDHRAGLEGTPAPAAGCQEARKGDADPLLLGKGAPLRTSVLQRRASGRPAPHRRQRSPGEGAAEGGGCRTVVLPTVLAAHCRTLSEQPEPHVGSRPVLLLLSVRTRKAAGLRGPDELASGILTYIFKFLCK